MLHANVDAVVRPDVPVEAAGNLPLRREVHWNFEDAQGAGSAGKGGECPNLGTLEQPLPKPVGTQAVPAEFSMQPAARVSFPFAGLPTSRWLKD